MISLSLAGRAAGFITPSIRAATATSNTPTAARPLSLVAARALPANYGFSSRYSLIERRACRGGTAILPRAVVPGYASYRGVHAGPLRMCTAQATAATDNGSSAVEVSAEAAALEAQIKSKGETIRDLKAEGTAKDALKPHIEVDVTTLRLCVFWYNIRNHPIQTDHLSVMLELCRVCLHELHVQRLHGTKLCLWLLSLVHDCTVPYRIDSATVQLGCCRV